MRAQAVYKNGTGKVRSEDFWFADFDGNRLKVAVGDWASNLVGGPYAHPETAILRGESLHTKYNGGVIGSTLVKAVIRSTELTEHRLIDTCNARINGAYAELGVRGVERNRAQSFTGYIAHAIVTPEKMVVTAVGDVRLAADGSIIAGRTKEIDTQNAACRAWAIENGEQEWFKGIFRDLILAQYQWQNSPGSKLSYPAIDGTETLPNEGVTVLELPAPRKLLLWSDGFESPDPEDGLTIEGLERTLERVYTEDPDRCKKYPALRGKEKLDDRTAVEIDLTDWSKFDVEQIGA